MGSCGLTFMKLACDLMKRAERDARTLMTNSEAALNPGFGCRVKGFTGASGWTLKGDPCRLWGKYGDYTVISQN